MRYAILPNGNLEFAIEPDDDPEEILSWPQNEADSRLLDACGLIGNGWSGVAPEWIGAMTDAPIITDDMSVHDDGSREILGRIWWFPNYAVENPYETLVRTGRVVFYAAPED